MSNPAVEWRPVVGYEGIYAVSSEGDVRSVDRVITSSNYQCEKFSYVRKGRPIKPIRTTSGYLKVHLHREGRMETKLVHRIVAEAFLGQSLLTVNHINEIKTDNRLCNLEYLTAGENIRYSSALAVECFDLTTGETIKVYAACKDVTVDGHDNRAVLHCCNHHKGYMTHHGYGWRFADE